MPQQIIQPANLVLYIDLDETMFVTPDRLNQVSEAQLLTSMEFWPKILNSDGSVSEPIEAYLLNKNYLEEALTWAAITCSHIVILTSGAYEPKSIINLLQNELEVSPGVRKKLGQARVHGATTDFKFFLENRTIGEAVKYTNEMDKAQRIQMLRKQFPELNCRGVLLDDSQKHISACNELEDMMTVEAMTMTADNKVFYKELIAELKLSCQELQTNTSDLANTKPIFDSSKDKENYCYLAVTNAEQETSKKPRPSRIIPPSNKAIRRLNFNNTPQTENDLILETASSSTEKNKGPSPLVYHCIFSPLGESKQENQDIFGADFLSSP